ncbi:hypothetical protein GCM10023149_29120 [Mucilaginibacter gynuensis]|uniref:Response regulatory domain-containing protein n=1 Tax=Mucilaginibacter gynuensis TaxID=1302236 RepID=A0ABP8GL91_9SPHI
MPKTILIAEDDNDILDIMTFLFNDENYRVIKSSGNDTIAQALIYLPDLIILDHRLGSCWGADLCRELKMDERTRHIPVIIMSATMHLEETGQSAGADAILAKPFDMTEVLALVKTQLQSMR